jgi:hypothetical protein
MSPVGDSFAALQHVWQQAVQALQGHGHTATQPLAGSDDFNLDTEHNFPGLTSRPKYPSDI